MNVVILVSLSSFVNKTIEILGNMGLKDQLESLRWVKRFIHNFGGDPEQVTVFGQSSGALMVNALQLSPKATGIKKNF